jgi:uncharacterized protein YeaO (DUF488 family)
MSFTIKRIYDRAEKSDGIRVLVDRLWPRGIKKVDAHLKLWMKEVAPSPKLRTWFYHNAKRFDEFGKRYRAELQDNPAVSELRRLGGDDLVTLLYAAQENVIGSVASSCYLRSKVAEYSRQNLVDEDSVLMKRLMG